MIKQELIAEINDIDDIEGGYVYRPWVIEMIDRHIPDDCVLMPKEPTAAMIEAGDKISWVTSEIYEALLKAAQQEDS